MAPPRRERPFSPKNSRHPSSPPPPRPIRASKLGPASFPAAEFYRWVEYCTSPAGTTTLADMRATAGYPEPFNVRFWGVGNESWGCGGNFTPQEYAVEFRRYTTWAPSYGHPLSFIGSG